MQLDDFILVAAVGLLATYAHLVMALWAPRYGLPRLDLPMGIADLTWAESFDGRPPYWMGFSAIHVNGILLALAYATIVGELLPGPALVRGVLYGGILYVVAQFFFVPLFLRGGLFGVKHHPMSWSTALVIHGIYGAILGWLCPIV